MAADLCKGVFNKILLKRLKMTKSSNACQSFRITAIALKLLGIILRLSTFGKSNLYLDGLPDFR